MMSEQRKKSTSRPKKDSGTNLLDNAADRMLLVLQSVGMECADPSTENTPTRFVKYLVEFHQPLDLKQVLGTPFDDKSSSMVIQHNIPFRMICEHHLLPATGRAALGYIPKKKVVGLSKLTRLVQGVGTEKPSLQEHICDRIAELLHNHLEPLGTMCVIQAEHGCMACRGVNSPGVITTSSCLRGVFLTNPDCRVEFLSLVGMGK